MERSRPTARPADSAAVEDDGSGLRADDLAPDDLAPAARVPAARSAADGPPVSEFDAQRVWRTAARLQAEAARRLDVRSEELAAHRADEAAPRAAFSREEVEQIATDAGIDPTFVALAWREVEAVGSAPPVSEARHARASALLGSDVERLGATRVFRAAPDEVLAAMQRVLPADPYRLALAEIVGDADTLADATLLFDVPNVYQQMSQTGGYTPFSYAMSTADLKRVAITLHPLGDGRTEATVSVDARPGKVKNHDWAVGLTAVLALVLGGMGFGVAAKATDGATAVAAGIGLATALFMTLVTLYSWRAAYRSGLKKGEKALAELLGAVDVDLRSGGAFARPNVPPRRPGGDAGLTAALSAG